MLHRLMLWLRMRASYAFTPEPPPPPLPLPSGIASEKNNTKPNVALHKPKQGQAIFVFVQSFARAVPTSPVTLLTTDRKLGQILYQVCFGPFFAYNNFTAAAVGLLKFGRLQCVHCTVQYVMCIVSGYAYFA